MAAGLTLDLLVRLTAGGRRRSPEALPPPRLRADIWIVVAPPAEPGALGDAIARLLAARPELTVAITAAPGLAMPADARAAPCRYDTVAEAEAALDALAPRLVVSVGPELPPALVRGAARRGLPVCLVDAALPVQGWRDWVPGLTRQLLRHCARILARDEASARALRRAGAPAERLTVAGPLEPPPPLPPCNEAERSALAWTVRARPVWLAGMLPVGEETAVIAAHRAALQLSHRLLLIVVPEEAARGPELARRLGEDEGFEVALRSREDEIEADTQVYVADTEGEIGLWFRLAPITFLGGSLSNAGANCSPLLPAAFGSAIIHGPRGGRHATAFARLVAARATRELRSASELAEAVSDFLAPDRAALAAHNAWQVCSAGAEVAGHIADALLGLLAARDAAAPEAGR